MTATGIEWADDVWNPVTRCTKVSPGCAHCYAEGVADRFWATQYEPEPEVPGMGSEGYRPRRFTDVRTHEDRLDWPIRATRPRRIFVNSMSDLFHEDVPDSFLDRVFAVMALASHHTFLVLTKRPERMRAYCRTLGRHASTDRVSAASRELRPGLAWTWALGAHGWHLPNVWLGVSAEDQPRADERVPILLDTPAAVRWVSAEPLIGPIDFSPWIVNADGFVVPDPPSFVKGAIHHDDGGVGLDWIVAGCESGAGKRPSPVAWTEAIVNACQGDSHHAAGARAFVKQLAVWCCPACGCCSPAVPEWPADECDVCPQRARLIVSKDPAEWPAALRIRDFPRAYCPPEPMP